MGVDARILVKITKPESWLTPEELRRKSAMLTAVIGSNKFFLEPEENRHALSFVKDEQAKWAAKYPNEYQEFDPNGPAIYGQDGPDVVAKPNEQFIECHVWGRFYGEGYARGDWQSLSFIMMWLIFNIPDCEVWYGGDSGGCELEKMTSPRMKEMTQFYLTSGNESYWMNEKCQYTCEFCGIGIVNSGGGGEVGFYHCNSCGGQPLVAGGDHRGRFSRSGSGNPTVVSKYDPDTDREMNEATACFTISDQMRDGTRPVYPFDGIFRIKYPYEAPADPKQLSAGTKLIEG